MIIDITQKHFRLSNVYPGSADIISCVSGKKLGRTVKHGATCWAIYIACPRHRASYNNVTRSYCERPINNTDIAECIRNDHNFSSDAAGYIIFPTRNKAALFLMDNEYALPSLRSRER